MSRCLSGMENLPSFCVVDVQGISIRLDDPNLTFNPELPPTMWQWQCMVQMLSLRQPSCHQ
jgi:hypothetical protein